ncbi:MAG: nitrogen fixation protein FixH, partial [Sulfitobacter sp.]|nr:nitrogen fixation protein FixH [Sulfitobacter sp.]
RQREAQLALGWEVSAQVEGGELSLTILEEGRAIAPRIEEATFGRATNVSEDQDLTFTFDGKALRAPVTAGKGNWNLRLRARAEDGTLFQQRIIVRNAG